MKAQSNWEEKSQYLLREIVKYDVYIDSLQTAMSLRLKKRGEKGKLTLCSAGTDSRLHVAYSFRTRSQGLESRRCAREMERVRCDRRRAGANDTCRTEPAPAREGRGSR